MKTNEKIYWNEWTGTHSARTPLGVGHIKTKTHRYYRYGTVTFFAALNYLDGKIIARSEPAILTWNGCGS